MNRLAQTKRLLRLSGYDRMIDTMIGEIPSYGNYNKRDVYGLSVEQVLEDWYVYRLEKDAERAMRKEAEKIREEERRKSNK